LYLNLYINALSIFKTKSLNLVRIEYTADERELIAFKVALYGGEYTYNRFI